MRLHRLAASVAAFVGAAATAAAQQPFATAGTWDPAVPTPRAVLGYELGERFTPHHLIVRYAERVAAAAPGRVQLDTLGTTVEGREILRLTVTSESNRQRLADIRRDAARVAAAGGDAPEAARRLPAIAWLGFTVHGNEASGVEAGLALLYQLAAGRDAATRAVLDSVVVLIDPVQNPDGHERHVQDNGRLRGTRGLPTDPASLTNAPPNWPGARTSHWLFDLNRDWFIHAHAETRARVATFTEWWPHVAVDLHEMGANSTYFFAPPMAPINANVPPVIERWWDTYAQANAAAFDAFGWSYFRREGYDEFWPGYGVSWPTLQGAVGMTYEQASSAGGAVRRSDGTVLTLREAAHHHYAAAWATLVATAEKRAQRIEDYLGFRRSAVSELAAGAFRAVVIERDAAARADSLAALLVRNGIAVRRAAAGTRLADATAYGERTAKPATVGALGAWVVDLAQPQGRLAKALLEPDAQLDSAFIREELHRRRTGQPSRFYDVTAWALPFAFRVNAWTTRLVPPTSDVGAPTPVPLPAAAAARYGYAFPAGREASLAMLARLQQAGVRTWLATKPFRVGPTRFESAFVVRTAANDSTVHAIVTATARETGAAVTALASALVDEGTDLGSNSVLPLKAPRVALLGGAPTAALSHGWAWYLMDQRLGLQVTAIAASAVEAGALDRFDVLVLPSAPAGALDRALGDGGRAQLQQFVRRGGVLVTLDGATAWLARESTGLSRLRTRRDSQPQLPTDVPGAVVRVAADTVSPLLAGVGDVEFPVLVDGDLALVAPRDARPGEVVAHYADAPRLRLAGYLWPEAPARLAGAPWLFTERVGRGRVIAFAGDPNFRDLWRGLLPIFANAVLLGPSF